MATVAAPVGQRFTVRSEPRARVVRLVKGCCGVVTGGDGYVTGRVLADGETEVVLVVQLDGESAERTLSTACIEFLVPDTVEAMGDIGGVS